MGYQELIEHLVDSRALRSDHIIHAFAQVDRADFVPPDQKRHAYEDHPLAIGFGQTISQPTTVAFMFELLQPQPGDKVLDVGSGSGWTTALLGCIVGDKGKVYGVELISDLVDFGNQNLAKYEFENASISLVADELGLPEKGPFDRILVSAAANEIPTSLVEQLKPGGTMVVPVIDSIIRIKKDKSGKPSYDEYSGFAFVPLIQ